MANEYYNLFYRNWINGNATPEQIQLAVDKKFITVDDAVKIKESQIKRNNVNK